jgi:sugar O-acyltransferase (sialic acid O-acetyltransferase NeuD family)
VSGPVIVIGGGGHGRVVIEAVLRSGMEILGVVDPDRGVAAVLPKSVPWLGDDQILADHPPAGCMLANGIGGVGTARRRLVFEKFGLAGYAFLSLRHPSATVASDVVLGEGCQVMAGAVLQPGAQVGVNAIVNTRAAVDHDCRIGAHAHIAPGAVLCGHVEIGANTHLGAGAVVIQVVRIGSGSIVGAGTTVLRDVGDNIIVYGRRREKRRA